ncbi:hypothetical protein GCM10017788_59070 [Amycolatopsis acidiphila]|nr:hypothetical protein GCM10017788_59070 [Amycolatopsis acidiphila]
MLREHAKSAVFDGGFRASCAELNRTAVPGEAELVTYRIQLQVVDVDEGRAVGLAGLLPTHDRTPAWRPSGPSASMRSTCACRITHTRAACWMRCAMNRRS